MFASEEPRGALQRTRGLGRAPSASCTGARVGTRSRACLPLRPQRVLGGGSQVVRLPPAPRRPRLSRSLTSSCPCRSRAEESILSSAPSSPPQPGGRK